MDYKQLLGIGLMFLPFSGALSLLWEDGWKEFFIILGMTAATIGCIGFGAYLTTGGN